MVKIQFYLLDIRKTDGGVILFGKTKDDQRVAVIDSFTPYFYVVPEKIDGIPDKISRLQINFEEKESKVLSTQEVKIKLNGKEIDAVKVTVPKYSDIKVMKSIIEQWEFVKGIYEFDIPIARRYLINTGYLITQLLEVEGKEVNKNYPVLTYVAGSIEPKNEFLTELDILSISIETVNPGKEDNSIASISLHGKNVQKTITWQREENMENVSSEVELIERFVEIIKHQSFDVITGYNTDGYIFPTIIARAKKYKINLDLGLDGTNLRVLGKNNSRTRINGICHVDLVRYMKNNLAIQVSFKELVDKYLEDDSGNEAKLSSELCKKFLPNIIELSKISNLQLDNVIRIGYSQIVETYLIKKAFERKEIVPNKPTKDEIAKRFLETYPGSFVHEPEPGIYDRIIVYDFKSLYPSIIVSHNISPETMDCDCCMDTKKDDEEHYFCQKKKGFFPIILEQLINERAKVDIDDPSKYTLKILANSFYGYLSFYASRWYFIEAAKIITSLGRSYIKKVIQTVEDEGFKIIYSDTDSIFIALQGKDREDSQTLIEKVNSLLPKMMELELQGFYKRGIFVGAKDKTKGAKKKYALLSADDEMIIKGFVRRNLSIIGRKVQKEVLELILKSGNIEDAKDYIIKIIDQIKNKELSNKETIITTILQKDLEKYGTLGPHVIVAKKMQDKGSIIVPGTEIQYIIVSGAGRINERAQIPTDVKEGDYDVDYYVNQQVLSVTDKILELFQISKDDIITKEQKKLGEF